MKKHIDPAVSLIAAVLVVLGSLAPAAAAEWGTLRGQFVYDGQAPQPEELNVTTDKDLCGKPPALVDESLVVGEEGGLANVLVYVRSKDVTINPDLQAPPEEPLTIDNVRCQFVPHVSAVYIEHPILLLNSDPKAHNTNIQPLGDLPINPLLAPGQTIEHKFGRGQRVPVPVQCNVHPWMMGYILPSATPYFAVSAEDGTFEIEGLPLGEEIEFQAWQERSGYLAVSQWDKGRFTLTLSDPTTDLGVIQVPPALLEKK